MNKAGEEVASLDVPVDRFVFFATEDAEVDVPIVNKKRMCRNGCCTTCAVKVLEGKVRHLTTSRAREEAWDRREQKAAVEIDAAQALFFSRKSL